MCVCVCVFLLFFFFSDKSSIAAALALQYGAACLCVDDVVTDMLLNGTSPVSLTARQLFDFAATEHAQKNAKEAGKLEAREAACDGKMSNTFNWSFSVLGKRLRVFLELTVKVCVYS